MAYNIPLPGLQLLTRDISPNTKIQASSFLFMEQCPVFQAAGNT